MSPLLLLLLFIETGVVVIVVVSFAAVVVVFGRGCCFVDDLVPGTKLNIVIININNALDKLEKVDWHPLSIPYSCSSRDHHKGSKMVGMERSELNGLCGQDGKNMTE